MTLKVMGLVVIVPIEKAIEKRNSLLAIASLLFCSTRRVAFLGSERPIYPQRRMVILCPISKLGICLHHTVSIYCLADDRSIMIKGADIKVLQWLDRDDYLQEASRQLQDTNISERMLNLTKIF